MYMSPLTVPIVPVSFAVLGVNDLVGVGLEADLIGGTSTCWIPFFAAICAWMRAATAASRNVSFEVFNCEVGGTTYQRLQLGQRQPFWLPWLGYRQHRCYLYAEDFCSDVQYRRPGVMAVISTDGRNAMRVELAQSDRTANALRCVSPSRPSWGC